MVIVTELNREPDGTFDTLEADNLNNADLANASEGAVLTSQGGGLFSMQTPGSAVATKTVSTYGDLPLQNVTERELYYVNNGTGGDYVRPTQLDSVRWVSLLDGTVVASDIPDSAIDYFEDGDIDEYSGATGNYSVQSNTVYEGDYALQSTGAGGKQHNILYNDGVTIQDGDVVRCYFNISSGQFGLGLQLQSATSTSYAGYLVFIRSGTDSSILKDGFSISSNSLDTTSIGDISGSWHYIDVDTSNGITADLYDETDSLVASVSSSNNDYTSGFYAFDYYDTSQWFADNLGFL